MNNLIKKNIQWWFDLQINEPNETWVTYKIDNISNSTLPNLNGFNIHNKILLDKLDRELKKGYKFPTGKPDYLKTLVKKVAYFIDEISVIKSNLTLTSNSLFFTFYFPNNQNVDFEVMYLNKINVEVFYSMYDNNELIASDYGTIEKSFQEIASLINPNESELEEDVYEDIQTGFKISEF